MRFLLFKVVKQQGHFLEKTGTSHGPSVSHYGGLSTIGLPAIVIRKYSSNKFLLRRNDCRLPSASSPIMFFKRQNCNMPVACTTESLSHHAQIAWKRLSLICSYDTPTFAPINWIARAVSWACSRSHMAPGIFAFIVGEVGWMQKASADAENLQTRSSPYVKPQHGHDYLVSIYFSVLEGVILFLRALYLTVLFTPVMTMAPFADSFGPRFRKLWLHVLHFTLEKAGPAFIKWGQWAATRSDLFPRDLCTELAKLHSKAPTHTFAYTKKAIEKAFGCKMSEIFDDFEEIPVASGSVAQVHRASLKFRYPDQRVKTVNVAVKVRHPGVGEAIRRDFILIDLVAKLYNVIPALRWLRLDESVQQFAIFMLSQVNLALEAENLTRFRDNFRRWRHVSFPKPLLVHPAVLVETYEQGESVAHYVDELEGHAQIKSALAHIGTHALLKMLLVDNFIHADMHPGNILVRIAHSKPSNKSLFKSRPHVVFLDVGMTTELSKEDHTNLLEFFKAVALRDGRTAAESTLKLSKRQNCPNPKAFIELPAFAFSGLLEVTKSFSFWGTPEGDAIHPAECMQHLLEQVRRHKVNIDGNVVTVMVTTLVLEGWQRKLDPDYDVMQTLQALLFRADWAKSLSYTIEGLFAP